ncbi:uncharacterized protein E0L32_010925 [Thyridium curvatum]|uniref:Uncharacterized protein n=1 Tax=Thyridium curvatum TaxID=1093900 RepID=A0A507ALS9_9PEZI|nr:uncharacterized protein E0L32_010925 [Thyridium curvatum]TPX07124.1 hypothetical protein E0L32_010925 [Thyridium curvatum]
MKPPDPNNSGASPTSKGQRLSQKLRDLRRIMPIHHQHHGGRDGKSAIERADLDNFEIIHTPDRPVRPILPENIPSDEECRYLLLAMHEEEEEKRRRRRAAEESEARRLDSPRLRQPLSPMPAERRAADVEPVGLSSPMASPPVWKGKEVKPYQTPSLDGNFENPRPAPSPHRHGDTPRRPQTPLFPLSPRPRARHVSPATEKRADANLAPPVRAPLFSPGPPTQPSAPPTPRRRFESAATGERAAYPQRVPRPAVSRRPTQNPYTAPLGIYAGAAAARPRPYSPAVTSRRNATTSPTHVAQQMRLISPSASPREISLRNTEPHDISTAPDRQVGDDGYSSSLDSDDDDDDDDITPTASTMGMATPKSTPTHASRIQLQRGASMESAMAYIRRRMDHEEGSPGQMSPAMAQQQIHPALQANSHIVRIGEIDHPRSQVVRAADQGSEGKHQSSYVGNDGSWEDDLLEYYCDNANFTSSYSYSSSAGAASSAHRPIPILEQRAQETSGASPEEVTFDLRKLIRDSLRGISEEWDEAMVEMAEKGHQEHEVTPTSPVLSRLPKAL